MALEFVSTECLRPEICEVSWRSFRSRLKGVDWEGSTLYLNIDPVPQDAKPVAADDLLRVARLFFGRVVVNRPAKANFARAVKWGWMQPRGSVFFYLQADWLLKADVDLLSLLRELKDWDAVNLRAYAHNWAPKHLCLSPVIIRSEVARRLASAMVDDVGPEAQLRRPSFREGGRSLGVDVRSLHWPREQHRVVLDDIGRAWMKGRGLQKKRGKPFVTWEKIR